MGQKLFVHVLGELKKTKCPFEIALTFSHPLSFSGKIADLFPMKDRDISQICNVGAATEGLMGINIPRKKLFFQ
jgi:hypothetical protein